MPSRALDFDGNFTSPAWAEAARLVCEDAGVTCSRLERAASSDHVVFMVDDGLVLKIFRPSRNCFEREKKALAFAEGRLPFRTPEIVAAGSIDGQEYLLTTRIPGFAVTRAEFLEWPRSRQIRVISSLAAGLRQIHAIDPSFFPDDWPAFVDDRASSFVERQIAHGVNAGIIRDLPDFLERNLPAVPRMPDAFLHGDVHFGNLRFESTGDEVSISGLFDFADSRRGFHEYDLLAVGVLMIQGERELQREFFKSYGYAGSELDDAMRDRMMMLTMLYETSDLRRYATRLSPDAVDLSLNELKRAIWNFV